MVHIIGDLMEDLWNRLTKMVYMLIDSKWRHSNRGQQQKRPSVIMINDEDGRLLVRTTL
jgi:hypothetical protein